MDKQAKDIGARIKIARESTGQSQKDFAKLADASYRAIQDYEAGNSVPGGKILERFIRMGFNANWLLIGEGQMKQGDSFERLPLMPNNDLLEDAMNAVDEYLFEINDTLPTAAKSRLVRVLYRISETRKMKPEREMVVDLVGLAKF